MVPGTRELVGAVRSRGMEGGRVVISQAWRRERALQGPRG